MYTPKTSIYSTYNFYYIKTTETVNKTHHRILLFTTVPLVGFQISILFMFSHFCNTAFWKKNSKFAQIQVFTRNRQ